MAKVVYIFKYCRPIFSFEFFEASEHNFWTESKWGQIGVLNKILLPRGPPVSPSAPLSRQTLLRHAYCPP
jgi:hypothetical protein